nr:cytochrome P450 88H10 [Tripterygium hypoglaucum]
MELLRVLGWVVASVLGGYVVVFWFLKKANEWYYCHGKKNLPPGDMGFPIVGNMWPFLRAFRSPDPESFLNNLVQRHGRTGIHKTHLFWKPLVIISLPELNKAVLTDDENFQFAYPNMAELIGKKSFVTLEGIEHKRLRKLTTAPINGQKALSMYIGLIENVLMTSFDEWASMNKPIELRFEIKHALFKVITNIFFGAQGYSFLVPLTKLFGEIGGGFFAKAINLPGFAYHKALKARKEMVKIVDATIEDRKVKNKNIGSEEKKCMLDLLLEVENEDGEKMDNETIIDLLALMVFGGHESTAIAVMWLFIYLHDNPQILQKVKEEQENIVSKRRSTQKGLTMEEIKQMDYTAKAFQEAIRMNLGVGAFRDAKADVEINGYTIPKGWSVLLMFRGIHLDPENFPDPKSFDPSRWDNNMNMNMKAGAYTPFGLGSRICPGNDLAKLEALIFVHCLLLHYKLDRVNPKSPVVYFPSPRPTDNYLVKITKLPK